MCGEYYLAPINDIYYVYAHSAQVCWMTKRRRACALPQFGQSSHIQRLEVKVSLSLR